MKLKRAVIPVLVSACLSGPVSLTHAQPQDTGGLSAIAQSSASDSDRSLLSQVESAHFIFRGAVTKVEYRLSDPSPEGAAQLPYTFVTYSIDELLKGESQERSVTLRFLGGPRDGDRIFQVEGTPYFDVGDRDILFVSDNGRSICPLVGCESGRFRLIDNQVFNDLGQPQSVAQTGELVSGKRVSLRDVLVNQVGSHTVEYEFSEDQDEAPNDGASKAAPEAPALPALAPTEFATQIHNSIQQLAREGRLQSRPVASADIKAPLVAPLANASAPPVDTASGQPSVTERQEQENEVRRRSPNQPVHKEPQS